MVSPAEICMLTMVGPAVERKYREQLYTQRHYAKVHGYSFHQERIDDKARKLGKQHATNDKPDVIRRFMNTTSCKWVCWFDADVYILNVGPTRSMTDAYRPSRPSSRGRCVGR